MQPVAPAQALHEWKATLEQREVFIWGAGQQGRGLCGVLQREGITLSGFIDRAPDLQATRIQGLPVYSPGKVLHWPEPRTPPFVIAAAFFQDTDIISQCATAGLRQQQDVISYKDIKPHDYVIDISGACNLRCLACPRSSRVERHPAKGLMRVDTFCKVLDKILREDPLVGSVQLYQWGEPLLHPNLPDIIRAANERGVRTAVSSNLSLIRDLKPVVAAKPAWFRVSVSGTEKEYEAVHVGAQWKTLHDNLVRLGQLRTALHPEMKAEVYYHIYRHNRGDSLDRVRSLCRQLNFEFHPVWAYLISLDDVLEHLEGSDLSAPAQRAEKMLALPLAEGMARAREEQDKDCPVLRCITINWDCTVSHCMMFFYPENNIAAKDFLETPLADIVAARHNCKLCERCQAQALHRYCAVYATQTVPLTEGTS